MIPMADYTDFIADWNFRGPRYCDGFDFGDGEWWGHAEGGSGDCPNDGAWKATSYVNWRDYPANVVILEVRG